MLERCWQAGFYKVMLLWGLKRTGAHAFYQALGFDRDAKQAFVMTRPVDRAGPWFGAAGSELNGGEIHPLGTRVDLDGLVAIYNEAVANSDARFEFGRWGTASSSPRYWPEGSA